MRTNRVTPFGETVETPTDMIYLLRPTVRDTRGIPRCLNNARRTMFTAI